MNPNEFIQSDEGIPDTHFFVYKDKKYPFKFDFFKYLSDYFKRNQKDFENNENIQLIEEEYETDFNFSDEMIQDFIKYVQNQQIPLNNQNVAALNYLSKKYEVKSLINITESYIEEHHDELVIDILTLYQKDSTFKTDTYEDILGKHLSEYIEDDRLFRLNLNLLFRILQKYEQFSLGKEDENIYEFLFKCLDIHGKNASLLFSIFDSSKMKSEHLNRLLTDYSEKFDFHFISSTFVRSLYENENHLLHKISFFEEKQTFQENHIKILEEEMIKFKFKYEEELNEMKRKQIEQEKFNKRIENENNQIKSKYEKELNEMKRKQIEQEKFNKRIEDENNQIKSKYEEEMNEMKRKQKEQEIYIKNIEKELKDIKSKQEQEQQEQKANNNEIHEQLKNIKEDTHPAPDGKQELIYLFNQITFNKLNGEQQLDVINEMRSISEDDKFDCIGCLLSYLHKVNHESKKENEKCGYIFFPTKIERNVRRVGISWRISEFLIERNEFAKPEFKNILECFSEVVVQIRYKSSNFDRNYSSILKLKEMSSNQIKIGILIDDIETTDRIFKGNNEISYVYLGSCIRKISSDGNDGSFEECSSLVQVCIPFTVTEIECYSFSRCSSLTQIAIPSSVTSIGEGAFHECSSLGQIAIPSSVTSIGNYAFNGCSSLTQIAIPSSVTSIGNCAFRGCSSLTQIAIPSSVISIGESAFRECSSLGKIAIPSSVTSIRNYAFRGCSSLTQIAIPSSVTSIGNYAFSGCSSLTQIAIPSSVTSIGRGAFDGCSSLTQVTLPSIRTAWLGLHNNVKINRI